MRPNPAIGEEVWQKLLELPSQKLPKRQARPVKRLTILAHELAADGLLPDAGKKAHAEMHQVLDGLHARYADQIRKARVSVLHVEGKTVKADIETGGMSFDDFVEDADYVVIEEAYKRAGRIISPDLAKTYAEHLAGQKIEDEDDALIDAHTDVAALGLVPAVKGDLEREAERLANSWFTKYRVEIKGLSDERQDIYRDIQAMSADPHDVTLARPTLWLQQTHVRNVDGTETRIPSYEGHMLCNVTPILQK